MLTVLFFHSLDSEILYNIYTFTYIVLVCRRYYTFFFFLLIHFNLRMCIKYVALFCIFTKIFFETEI